MQGEGRKKGDLSIQSSKRYPEKADLAEYNQCTQERKSTYVSTQIWRLLLRYVRPYNSQSSVRCRLCCEKHRIMWYWHTQGPIQWSSSYRWAFMGNLPCGQLLKTLKRVFWTQCLKVANSRISGLQQPRKEDSLAEKQQEPCTPLPV